MTVQIEPITMSDTEKEAARKALAVAQSLVDSGDLRGYARALTEAAGLAQAAVAERE